MFTKISKLCKKNKITVTQLEKMLGFGRGTIAKWKKSSPTVEKLKAVADYFGVSIEYFINDSEEQIEEVIKNE